MSREPTSYFSISFHSVPLGRPLAYDLYINSSAVESREKFIRIFPRGESLDSAELARFRDKYRQLYLPEEQRSAYLESLTARPDGQVIEKARAIKDSAISYLDNLFRKPSDLTPEALSQNLHSCKDSVEAMVDLLQGQSIDGLKELIGNLSFHDFYTYDHSINVSMYSMLLYRSLHPEATRGEITLCGLGGLLHDIGKIRIPTQIINKPGKLSELEFKKIQSHPGYGVEALRAPGVRLPQGLDPVRLCRIVLEHHENFDGSGYPAQLSSQAIDEMARVTAIADFFDAITTKRAYAPPLGTAEALAVMARSAGKKIDPALFEVFSAHVGQYPLQPGQAARELPSDFDPCQPHLELPLRSVSEAPAGEKSRSFGKIVFLGEAKSKPEKK